MDHMLRQKAERAKDSKEMRRRNGEERWWSPDRGKDIGNV